MGIELSTFDPKTPRPIVTNFQKIREHASTVDVRLGSLEGRPSPLTLDQIRDALEATGSTPLNITQLIGNNPGVISRNTPAGTVVAYGLHAARLAINLGAAKAPPQVFFETDRRAAYAVVAGAWLLVGNWQDYKFASGDRPGDLGAESANFLFFSKTLATWERWSGAAWHYVPPTILIDVIANRPTAAGGTVDVGVIFIATDQGGQAWRMPSASDWLLLKGIGNPMAGALSSKPSLSATDAGFQFNATDFDRIYEWTGSAWFDAPGQPRRGFVQFRNSPNVPTGWALCDGSSTTVSQSDGSSAAYTTPNLTGSTLFVRSNTTPGGTGGNASVTSGNDSGTQPVAAGGGPPVTVPAEPHTHSVATVPPYYDLVPMVRL